MTSEKQPKVILFDIGGVCVSNYSFSVFHDGVTHWGNPADAQLKFTRLNIMEKLLFVVEIVVSMRKDTHEEFRWCPSRSVHTLRGRMTSL